MARRANATERLTERVDRISQRLPKRTGRTAGELLDRMNDDDARSFIGARLGELIGDDPAAARNAAPWAYRWVKADDPDVSMPELMTWNAADPTLYVWPLTPEDCPAGTPDRDRARGE